MSTGLTPSDIHPCLSFDDAPAAIEWLCRAFGFTKRFVVDGPEGTVLHSELSLGTGVIMVSSTKEGGQKPGTAALSVCVPDPDTHYLTAMGAGAKLIRPLQDEDYGARGYMVEDLAGNQWYFGDYRPGAYWKSPEDRS